MTRPQQSADSRAAAALRRLSNDSMGRSRIPITVREASH